MEQNFNIINNYKEEEYNLLFPVQSIQEINPIFRLVVNIVRLSTETSDRDIYREKSAEAKDGPQMFAFTHKALMKFFAATNGQVIESKSLRPKVCEKCIDIVRATGKAPACGNCNSNADVCCRMTTKFPELSGGWRIYQATREINFSNMGNATENQIRQMKAFAYEHAESKALSRCIRKALSIKSAYTLTELVKPFIVVYPVLDARDADVKKALISGSIAASNLLYGSGFMLNANQQAALPEVPANVDRDTGEIYEAGYEAGPPDVGNSELPKPWENAEPEKYYCSNPECKAEIAKNVYEASVKQFGAGACIKCQSAAKKGGK
ncbi:MAG: hypothetical protein PHV93_04900 [Candidatus Pacebacteria bacterium]|nr:hypothetical protein [Candidatus Paceibacterota bacterium]